jgi:methylglutaconyl-CoA hydratase
MGPIARLILNRPHAHNALSEEMIRGLADVLLEIDELCCLRSETGSEIRVLQLVSQGTSFCAGADLKDMLQHKAATETENIAQAQCLGQVFQRLYALPIPTIAVIQGPAFGGGVGLAACCDIVFASQEALFCLSEVRLGLLPAVISPYLVAALGQRRAKRLMLSAERFSAEKALEWGLVDAIYTQEDLQAEADQWSLGILDNSPSAMRAVKQLVDHVGFGPTDDQLDLTSRCIAKQRVSEEGQEGMNAFFEKRKPQWAS